ncbi:MAG TPA: nucleotide sugar dehydrogenase [Steroidobacteraceae bacterium]|nr:nucleotide sugar dehydrogenase [Steroidobacteraceae bacterium]
MPLSFKNENDFQWVVKKIVVIGPGIVGMPMAALLAHARIREGSDEPAKVLVLQRNSRNSGWKVDAINSGRSVIGGVEPALDNVVADSVRAGVLSASHDYTLGADADMVLVCVQTDKDGFGPDYGPLFEALEGLAVALKKRPAGNIPVICFESTLAPSSMTTLVREFFAKHGLVEGKDILLGNSPNRVMPGRLVERVAASDKLVAGLHPLTPKLIQRIYSRIVTRGKLHATNSMTAEVVKTLENAYRDVRIAFAAEVVRYCDANDIDFFALRDAVNARLSQSDAASASATAVPSGGVLVPTTGVGGHCLPKDGILLWWRMIESGADTSHSLILESRKINDDSPAQIIKLAEKAIGKIDGKRIALLGTAYRFDSEDTRNSPTLYLARLLLDRKCSVTIHDPYVKGDDQNLRKFALTDYFTNDMAKALDKADVVFVCTGHAAYVKALAEIKRLASSAKLLVDGANTFKRSDFDGGKLQYVGIGRGTRKPSEALVKEVEKRFRDMEAGVGNELTSLIAFLNGRYAADKFNQVQFSEVQRIAATCPTGCAIADPGKVSKPAAFEGFSSKLVSCAVNG